MALFSFGISYKTAPVSIREKVAFSTEQIVEFVLALKQADIADEAVVVSTCNRTEVYLTSSEFNRADALNWLTKIHGVNSEKLNDCLYFYSESESVRHVMQVACGLDSMVLGEPQILGQLKQAYAVADQHRFIGDYFI